MEEFKFTEDFKAPEGGVWSGSGERQEVAADRMERAGRGFDQEVLYATKSETHLWVTILVHRASDQTLDALSGVGDGQPILDAETLTQSPATVCYICSEPFDPRLRRRKCKGDSGL